MKKLIALAAFAAALACQAQTNSLPSKPVIIAASAELVGTNITLTITVPAPQFLYIRSCYGTTNDQEFINGLAAQAVEYSMRRAKARVSQKLSAATPSEVQAVNQVLTHD